MTGKADLTSAFTKVECYLKCVDIATKSKKGTYTGYDPVAWATGEVHETPTSDPEMKRITIGNSSAISIKVPTALEVVDHATKGQGLSFQHGDYYVKELLQYCGIEAAQRYLTFKLFSLYKSECELATVHFELLVASMTRHMILSTDRSDLRVGQYHTTVELNNGDLSHTEYVSRILSVQDIPSVSNEAFDTINLEDPVYGLSRACALKLKDSLSKPINRMVLGQTIIDGSRTPGFLEKRRGEY